MPVGDEADAVGRAKAMLAPDRQVPETVPVLPSNTGANPVVEEVVDGRPASGRARCRAV